MRSLYRTARRPAVTSAAVLTEIPECTTARATQPSRFALTTCFHSGVWRHAQSASRCVENLAGRTPLSVSPVRTSVRVGGPDGGGPMALTLCSQTHQPQRVSVRFRQYVVEPDANACRLMGCEPQSECHWEVGVRSTACPGFAPARLIAGGNGFRIAVTLTPSQLSF